MKKKYDKKEREAKKAVINSNTFVIALALVSILGFIGIISETIFYRNINGYIQSFWILILGIGLLVETKYKKLKSIKKGLNNENFPQLTNLLVGIVAVLAGILSLPAFNIKNPSFEATRGILSLIAIIIIVIQTWVIQTRKSPSKIRSKNPIKK